MKWPTQPTTKINDAPLVLVVDQLQFAILVQQVQALNDATQTLQWVMMNNQQCQVKPMPLATPSRHSRQSLLQELQPQPSI